MRLSILAFLSLLLFGCAGLGNQTEDSEGLKISFSNLGDRYIAGDFLNLEVQVENNGEYNQPAGRIFLGGFDSTALRFQRTEMPIPGLMGRSSELDGEIDYIEFRERNTVEVPLGDVYEPIIQASVCYEYQTAVQPNVCIITNPNDIGDTRVCKDGKQNIPKHYAPVKVTDVEERIGREFIQFIITVKNSGNGEIVNERDLDMCPFSLNPLIMNKVQYEVSLSGFGNPECLNDNNTVILHDGEGKIVCNFVPREISEPYTTPLTVHLNYGYTQSIQKQITIKDPLYVGREVG